MKVGREWTRNTAGLLARATSKATDARRRAEHAIEELVVEQQPVNFSAVAERAGVSKTYLYNDADLRTTIESLRDHRRIRTAQRRQARVQTDTSLKVVIAAKDRQIALLQGRVKQLERELVLVRGQFYASMEAIHLMPDASIA
jgi:Family of unknown function (DUF6262)